MRKTTAILAGAMVFDLGVFVVPVNAAPTHNFLKYDAVQGQRSQTFTFLKIDQTQTRKMCTDKGGTVVMHEGSPHCRLPAPPAR